MMRLLKSPRLLLTIGIVAAIAAAAFWPESMVVDVVTVTEGPMQVTIDDAMDADETFDMLMGSAVPPRKKFIQTHARDVQNLDV